MTIATVGAGCFWGVEQAFREMPGVTATAVGYAGGLVENPTYEQVCSGRSGHAEVVQVEFDAGRVSYDELLKLFWSIHDPTQTNRQGPDVGEQYRSVIFYDSADQQRAATESKEALESAGTFRKPIATKIEPAPTFWRAEDYHQQYLAGRGQAGCSLPQRD